MITRIYIDNYRCFTNFEFAPQRINLLLGANGSGKSALFEVLAGVVDVVVNSAEVGEVFPANTRTRWDPRTSQRVEMDVVLGESTFRHMLVLDQQESRAVIREEQLSVDGKLLAAYHDRKIHLHSVKGKGVISIPFAGNRSYLGQLERPEVDPVMIWKHWISETWSLGLDARSMKATSKQEHVKLVHDGSNFASWYRHLSQENPERLQDLWKTLAAVLPGFRILKLESSGRARVRDIVVVMAFDSSEYQLYFDELSAGQRALVVLYTLLEARGGEGCLLLDEPEAHVGLAEVQPWLVKLDDLFTDRGQVFLASHNSEVIDYMAAGHPFLIERPHGGPARVRAAVFDRETGLSASEQVARGFLDVG